jgi:hypothetical protein
VVTNEPCTGVRSCCDTLCLDAGLGTGVGYCFAIGGCKTYADTCTKDKDCCSGKCGTPDAAGLRRCDKVGSCVPDGDVCGGLGASQNCCSGGKDGCHKTITGVSRCVPNFGTTCYGTGHSCSLADECCSFVCTPDPTSPTGFSCNASCIPLGSGTCTTDADCCSGGLCQGGVCKPSGSTCVPVGGKCTSTVDCCFGSCVGGFCSGAG